MYYNVQQTRYDLCAVNLGVTINNYFSSPPRVNSSMTRQRKFVEYSLLLPHTQMVTVMGKAPPTASHSRTFKSESQMMTMMAKCLAILQSHQRVKQPTTVSILSF